MIRPDDVQLIGDEVAVRWADGAEDYFPMEMLRAASPSAENVGEPDLFGNIRGGDARTKFPGVTVTGVSMVGNYALRFSFSDGHSTGIYSFDYLRRLGQQQRGDTQEG